MDDAITVRVLHERDAPILITATLENLNWSTTRFTREQVLATPAFRAYTEFVSSRGDRGSVAIRDGVIVGVAWCQFLPAPGGYGFIDPTIPEMSVWVHRQHRGRGIGRRITGELLRTLAAGGVTDVSLSVEEGNHRARGLYASLGFASVAGRERDGVMRRTTMAAAPER